MNFIEMDVGALKERLHEMRMVEGINTIALPRDEFIELERKLKSYHVFYAPAVSDVPKVDQIYYSGTTIYPLDEIENGWEPDGQEVGYEENNFRGFEDYMDPDTFSRMAGNPAGRAWIQFLMKEMAKRKGFDPSRHE